MSWKQDFSDAVKYFRKGELLLALEGFNRVIDNGGRSEYVVYDSRSAVLEKLGRRNDALKDARTTIQLAPEQWQGYARAARQFFQSQKFDSAMKMVDMALRKLKEEDTKRHKDLLALKDDISLAQDELIRRTTNHWTHLPVELFSEIAGTVVDDQSTHLIPLSQVCKDWRRAVWNNPHLWTTLVLGRSRPHIKARRWVERSKGKIRTLKINATACYSASWNGEGLEDMHWDQLQICQVRNWDICRFLSLTGSTTSLASLTRYEFSNEDPLTRIQHPFHISWPIQHLDLTAVPLPPYFADLNEKDLLSLVLRKIPGQVKLALGPHRRLQKLVLDTVEAVFDELPDDLSNLQHLEIRRMSRPMLLLLHLPMPHLATLHLETSPFSLGSTLDSLISGSSGQLTTLVLRAVPLNEPIKLIELLRVNPTLITLELSRIQVGASKVVEALVSASDSASLPSMSTSESLGQVTCPNLTHLNVTQCHDLRTGPVVRLIKSRNVTPSDGIQKIATLMADGCEHIEADCIQWLRNNVENFSCSSWARRSTHLRR